MSEASGVRLNEAFSGRESGQYAPLVFRGCSLKHSKDMLLFHRSAIGVSVSTPAVLYVRAKCASLFSIFFALYEYGIFVIVSISTL